jgi:hypothetical protein
MRLNLPITTPQITQSISSVIASGGYLGLCFQCHASAAPVEALHEAQPIDKGHDDVPVSRAHALVDDQDVPIEDLGPFHRVPWTGKRRC